MRRILILILFSIVSISAVSALNFSFSNDGTGLGFIPEWDDYETYAFSLEQSWGSFTADIDYNCYTYRADSIEDAARIDSIQLSSLWNWNLNPAEPLNLKLACGGSVRFFGDWYGMEIQTGWHQNISVLRDVPESYELPFFQFVLPLEASLTFTGITGPRLRLYGAAGFPLELAGAVELGYSFEDSFYPLNAAIGFRAGLYPDNSAAYRIAMEKMNGLYLSNRISYWPVKTEQVYYLQQQWGKGVLGFTTEAPAEAADPSVCLQLMVSGITTNSFGFKARKLVLEDMLLQDMDLWLSLTSLTGWSPENFSAPESGRFSDLLVGAEPGWSAEAGPVRFELAVFLNGGIRQNNYYDIDQFEQVPKESENMIILESGAGVKVLLPFLNGRMIGPAFEIARQWRLASFPREVTGLSAPEIPYRLNLSLAVTAR